MRVTNSVELESLQQCWPLDKLDATPLQQGAESVFAQTFSAVPPDSCAVESL